VALPGAEALGLLAPACREALVAAADQVQAVVGDGETALLRDLTERALEAALRLAWQLEVGHGAAHTAGEVVMMAEEVLRQLEACELAVAGDAVDEEDLLEDGEVAVHGALRQRRRRPEDLGDGQGLPGIGEGGRV
jgi:hypothetical protein